MFTSIRILLLSLSFLHLGNEPTVMPDDAKWADNPVIAHRGAWKKNALPENSIASLREAIRLGCFGSEFDVHLTKDDMIVVNHDPKFMGMDIAASNYPELLAQKLPNGESIPTAEAYLREGITQKKTKLIYEIKASSAGKERTLELTKRSVELVKSLHAGKWVDYISFDYDACKLVRQLDPKASVSYLTGDKSPEQLKADGISGFDYHFSVLEKQPGWIAAARQMKLSTNAWTVNDSTVMRSLLEQKIDYITTNEPELLFSLIQP
ncbi:glycerophosphodiester phosphodiesterase [Flavihumibacter petaseus]|uniref:Putative glycerophosphoryl diester phosphodiesterase n=1 Tax=Flavihumibacter petaseus NBRC 106054 TaxID=1220578 RepID=A0A0E9MY53_9BACT|nr:glycerophosphodiester phosphodiesterase family protein [Flavihumibacter petaseus]GAO42662.1 putative glycerophosphoryl diester phosphodiesterase [Flavihumibacter petaseus NBRC 106054]